MQFQVPQFIETEDKIVGPLSLKQFGFIGGGGFIVFALYFLLDGRRFVWFVLSIPIVALALGLAFIKINGRPLLKVIQSALAFYWKPQTYVWLPQNPKAQKTAETMRAVAGSPLDGLISGLTLKNIRTMLQTGDKKSHHEEQPSRYEILQRLSGERQAARRVDYTKK